ncbi:MAG: hypothetical protein AMJ46_12605 [Latescibacteria bacterium DG_63]|nr:MAG: hypothetical protein AMJ46_12605 [Latescibacteria bacterium DG_63]
MAVALTDHALTTLAEAKTELGIRGDTENDYVSRLINAASDAIRRYCNRTFYYEADIEESIPGFGGTRLVVARTPIVGTIDSITYEGTALDATTYSVEDAEAGFIYRQYGFNWTAQLASNTLGDALPGSEKLSYVVTYTGGYYTPQQYADDDSVERSLPYDLEDACLQLITARYRAKGRDPRVSAERLLSWQVSYGMATTDRAHGIPKAVQTMLDPYRRIACA